MAMEQITFDDFLKVDMRVGEIVAVEDSPAKKPSYKLTIDLGPEIGTRTGSAGLRNFYTKEELLRKQVVCVVNFPPRQVATVSSEVLVLGAVEADGTVKILRPNPSAVLGSRIG